MLKISESKSELNVVSDQIGSPTYTVDLSKLVIDMIQTDKYGVYHATNEGFVSWADFAREIFKVANKNVKVYDVTTEEYNAKAKRPKNSRLDKSKLIENGFCKLPTWQDALNRFLKEL
jgi:dTDP-4-dehydrorhamnose reductase